MDPDLVRQQAEAELEQRNGAPVVAKNNPQPDAPPLEAPFVAAPEQPEFAPAIEAPAASRPGPIKPPGWRIQMQALFSSGALAALAALTAAAWGGNYGFSPEEQVWLGGGAAALMTVIYGLALSVSGNNFMPAGSGR